MDERKQIPLWARVRDPLGGGDEDVRVYRGSGDTSSGAARHLPLKGKAFGNVTLCLPLQGKVAAQRADGRGRSPYSLLPTP
jgi:hypothetical protein